MISAYEQRLGVTICVHDYAGALHAVVPSDRIYHDRNPFCRSEKALNDIRCSAFDLRRLQNEITRFPDGGCKRCHAGFLELFIPLHRYGRIEGMLFAGIFLPKNDTHIPLVLSEAVRRSVRSGDRSGIPRIDERMMHEHLAVLSLLAAHIESAAAVTADDAPVNRRQMIDRFIETKYNRDPSLDDLCRTLGLNPSRTSEVIRTLYAKTFPELINARRLQHARHLLAETALPVHFVAAQCGYENTEYFFRIFKKQFRMTPLAWRGKRTGKKSG